MGNLTLNGSTSGQITLTPPAVAGTNTITLPAATGTVLTTAGGQTISGTVTLSTLTSPAATNLTIQSAGTTAMTIDTSQNVGIGTSSPGARLDVNGGRSFFAANSEPYSIYLRYNGSTAGFYIGSPAADVMSFSSSGGTERMRIDSSGNVGIGTTTNYQMNNTSTTPKQMIAMTNNTGLNILRYNGFGGNGAFINLGASGGASLGTYSGAVASSGLGSINFGGDNGTNYNGNGAQIYAAASETWTTSTNAGYLVFLTTPSGSVSPAERMRIDSSGNLLVGTTSSNGRLSVDGAGATSATYAVYVRNSTPSDLFYLRNDGFFSTGGASSSPYNATTATAANVVVASNGQLQRSTSSLKYKTDVKDSTHGLAEVMQLRPVTYKGKNDGDTIFGGLIAEEVDAVGLTEFVQYAEDGSPDALAYGNMVSLLVKSIQEQQVIISDLKSRIAALEAK